MKKFWTVFMFHLRENILAKSTIIMGAILFLVGFGLFAYSHFSKDEDAQIVVISESSNYSVSADELNELTEGIAFTVQEPNEVEAVRNEIKDGDIDSLIVISEKDGVPTLTNISNTGANSEAVAIVSNVIQQQYIGKIIVENDVAPEVAASIQTGITVEYEMMNDIMSRFGISYFFGFLLYFFILMFGQGIATLVVSEKQSRVMEVMISKVKPMYMMYAKILSNFCLAIIQLSMLALGFVLALILGWVNVDNLSLLGIEVDLSGVGWELIIAFVVFFSLGYLLYGMMYAAAGSVVSKMEELQSVVLPITFLGMGGFFIMMFSLTNPIAPLVQVASYIPFFSPFVTFARLASGEAGTAEIGIVIALMVATIAVITYFANRIYVNGVMHYSEKFNLKDIGGFLKRH